MAATATLLRLLVVLQNWWLEGRLGQVPPSAPTLAYGLERLVASVMVMRAARAADAGSPARMLGALRVLINDRWAYTSYGLEAVSGDAAFRVDFPLVEAGYDGGPVATMASWGGRVRNCVRPGDEPEAEWDEAITWLTKHEGLQVAAPDET